MMRFTVLYEHRRGGSNPSWFVPRYTPRWALRLLRWFSGGLILVSLLVVIAAILTYSHRIAPLAIKASFFVFFGGMLRLSANMWGCWLRRRELQTVYIRTIAKLVECRAESHIPATEDRWKPLWEINSKCEVILENGHPAQIEAFVSPLTRGTEKAALDYVKARLDADRRGEFAVNPNEPFEAFLLPPDEDVLPYLRVLLAGFAMATILSGCLAFTSWR